MKHAFRLGAWLLVCLVTGAYAQEALSPPAASIRVVREQAALKEESFLFRIPALSGGPIDGLEKPLPVQTVLTLTLRSQDDAWAFAEVAGRQGWVPSYALDQARTVSMDSPSPPPKQAVVFPSQGRPFVAPESELLRLLNSPSTRDSR